MTNHETQFTPHPIPDGLIEANGGQYMLDGTGNLRAIENIKPADKLRDEMVRDGLTSVQIMQQFETRFGAPAHEPRIYSEHFGRQYLDHARHRLGELDRLLRAFAAPSA